MKKNKKLDMMIDASNQSGVPVDLLWSLSKGLSDKAFRKLIGNCASTPLYMKSMVTPNLLHKTSASSGMGRLIPDSQPQ